MPLRSAEHFSSACPEQTETDSAHLSLRRNPPARPAIHRASWHTKKSVTSEIATRLWLSAAALAMSRARISIARLLCSFSRISQMWISLSRRSKRFRFRCKWALLPCGGTRVLAFLYSEAAEESVYDSASMKQVFQRAECCHGMCRESSLRLCKRGKVSPVRRDKRFTAVGQDQNEMQSTVSMDCSKNSE